MKAHVYILQSSKGKLYIGATGSLNAMIVRHNSGAAHSTKRLGIPLKLITSLPCTDIVEVKREETHYKFRKNSKNVRASH